jgi:hypothetical protein
MPTKNKKVNRTKKVVRKGKKMSGGSRKMNRTKKVAPRNKKVGSRSRKMVGGSPKPARPPIIQRLRKSKEVKEAAKFFSSPPVYMLIKSINLKKTQITGRLAKRKFFKKIVQETQLRPEVEKKLGDLFKDVKLITAGQNAKKYSTRTWGKVKVKRAIGKIEDRFKLLATEYPEINQVKEKMVNAFLASF